MATTQDEMIAELQRANVELRQERDAALAQKAALAEVLEVINRSPGILGRCSTRSWRRRIRLCGAAIGSVHIYDGEHFARLAHPWLSRTKYRRAWCDSPFSPRHHHQTMIRGDRLVHVPDVRSDRDRADEARYRAPFVERIGCANIPRGAAAEGRRPAWLHHSLSP